MHRAFVAVTFLLAPLAAQQSIGLLSGPGLIGGMTFDSARNRAVELSPLGELFEYVGGERLHRANLAPTGPSARQFPALVYDPVRRHVLLFGGYDGTPLADTWTWDGFGWTQLPGPGPAGRESPGITFDTASGRVLLFGGFARGGNQFNDTWEHDGSQWTERFPTLRPFPPNAPALAFDSVRARGVLVLANGIFGGSVDTFEWDGTNWQQRASGVGPKSTNGYAIAYDAVRQRTVVGGGGSLTVGATTVRAGQEVWEWNGTTWTLGATLTKTLRRYTTAWFDGQRGTVVLAGGDEPTGDVVELELSDWNGSTLVPQARFEFPAARYSQGWTSSPTGTVLFGGQAQLAVRGDTWTWTGYGWVHENPPTSPPARAEPAMAFQVASNRSLLFGGGALGTILADFWAWNGTTWSALPSGPPARYGAGLVEDFYRGEVVLFGGANGPLFQAGSLRNDTWIFDGTSWSQRASPANPSPRHAPAMAFDLVRGVAMVFGGRLGATAADQLDDTWEWNGAQWLLRSTATRPPALLSPRLEYDWGRARVQLQGNALLSPGSEEQLWEFDGIDWRLRTRRVNGPSGAGLMARCSTTGAMACFDGMSLREWSNQPAQVQELGVGCGAPTPRLAMRTRPRVGTANSGLELRAGSGLPVLFAFDAATTSLPLGNGCTALVGGGATFAIGATDGLGIATMLAAVPTDVAFRLTPLFAQGAVLDPTQPGGFAVSGGLRVQIGD